MELGAWDIAAVAVKAITYAATFGAAGGVFYIAYSSDLCRESDRPRIKRLIALWICFAGLASLARILVLAGSMSGEIGGMFDRTMLTMISHAGEGRATGVRVAGLMIAGLAMLSDRRHASIAILGAALAATSFAWVGHPHAALPNALPTLIASVHLLCVAFWLGALPPLLLITHHARDPLLIARTAERFGQIAVVAVGVLILAGASLVWALLGTLSDFWTTGYGRVVTIKIGVVACLLSVAAYNKLRLTPGLRVNNPRAACSLRRSIQLEILLGGLILLATAALTTLVGPKTAIHPCCLKPIAVMPSRNYG